MPGCARKTHLRSVRLLRKRMELRNLVFEEIIDCQEDRQYSKHKPTVYVPSTQFTYLVCVF